MKSLDVRDYLAALEKAINDRDKKAILELYDDNPWEWDKIPATIADQYDALVDRGNEILGI